MGQEEIIQIIEQVKKGSEPALSSLIRKTIGLAMVIAKNILINTTEIDDAVQESYIKVWKHIRSYNDHKGSFTTWFCKIVQNECLDRNKKIKLQQHQQLSNDIVEPGQQIDDKIHYAEIKNFILNISHTLPTKQREVFIMRDVQNLTIEEVQKASGLSIGSIKTNLYLARKKIREVIEKEEINL